MLAYLAIFATALAGFAAAPPYVAALCAIALSSLSYIEHSNLYDRGRALGMSELVGGVLLRSIFNGLLAGTLAYGGGWLLRYL